MADVPDVIIINVHTFKHGSDRINGIMRMALQVTNGQLITKATEGNILATVQERVGSDAAPVAMTIECDGALVASDLISRASATITVDGDVEGGATDKRFTIANCMFASGSVNAVRNNFGGTTVNGQAVSSDGSTHPLSIADAT